MATVTLRPTAEGDLIQNYVYPTDGVHWDKVDEATPDEDATYVHRYGGVVGAWGEDNSELENLPGGVGTITNVRITVRVRRIAQSPGQVGVANIGRGVRVNGSSYYSTFGTTNDSYFDTGVDYVTNPDTGVAWTISDVNSLQSLVRNKFVNYALFQGGFTSSRCTQVSAVVTFDPILAPTGTTDPATSVAANSSTLNGTLDDDGGEACDCGFEWGLTDAYGNTTPTQSRTTGQTFAQAISGLSPGTTYHFRVVVTNTAGTSYGADRTFTTLGVLSTVTTDPASGVGMVLANLNGTLDDDGGLACDCGFEWGLTTAYGNTTPTQSRTTGQTFSQAISGLDLDTTYHFRALSTNVIGTSYGVDRTFTTKEAISRGYALSRHEL